MGDQGAIESLTEFMQLMEPYKDFDFHSYPLDLQGGIEHHLFVELIDQVRPKVILEVGSWKGKSAIGMAAALKEKSIPGTVICIDTWLGTTEHYLWNKRGPWGIHQYRKNGYPQLYYQFLANVMHVGLQDYIVPFPATSAIAAECFGHWKLKADLIYVDGSHTEVDVYQDLVHFWPLLRFGGVIFGDDWWGPFPGVERAVRRFAGEQGLLFQTFGPKWLLHKSLSDGQSPDPLESPTSASALRK